MAGVSYCYTNFVTFIEMYLKDEYGAIVAVYLLGMSRGVQFKSYPFSSFPQPCTENENHTVDLLLVRKFQLPDQLSITFLKRQLGESYKLLHFRYGLSIFGMLSVHCIFNHCPALEYEHRGAALYISLIDL